MTSSCEGAWGQAIPQEGGQGLRMKTAEHCRNYCRHPLLGSGADRIISFPRKAGRFTVKLQQIVHYNSRA